LALRLLQFLGSLQKILVNRTPDEFRQRSAGLFGQPFQLLQLVFLEEQGRALHVPILYHRHTYIHTERPWPQRENGEHNRHLLGRTARVSPVSTLRWLGVGRSIKSTAMPDSSPLSGRTISHFRIIGKLGGGEPFSIK
jgi:hypothetical protein